MKVLRDMTIAGKTILVSVRVPSGRHRGKRKNKYSVTKEAVQKNNMRVAAKNLTVLLNANFDENCAHITLTYKGEEPTNEEAKNDRKNFLRKLRRHLGKIGKELKYIAVTEYENKRIHHHVVVNTQDIAMLNKIWGKGFVYSTMLDDSGNYRKLAEYLIKETEKTFRLQDSVHKHRYTPSRNLYYPTVKREEVSVRELSKDPQPLKGYYIPRDEVRRFEHPVTGLEHLEYIMVALDRPKKYKTWPKGKVVKDKEYFKVNKIEEQERMW